MKKTKFIFTLFVGIAILAAQVGSVFAAPALQDGSINGKVTALECGADSEGNTIILVTVENAVGTSQTVGIDLETAESLGLVTLDEGGLPDCSAEAFAAILDAAPEDGLVVEIAPEDVIPVEEEEAKHPVGLALSLFFEDITDYDVIMDAHEDGTGFGVIAQALWLTAKMEGDSDVFLAILEAKETGNYDEFALEDGTTFQNWGQFKKAVLDGDKKGNLGVVMSGRDSDDIENNGNGNGPEKDKSNNGNKNKDKDKGKKD